MVHIKDPLLLIRMTFPSFPSKKKDNMHLVPCSIPYLPHTLWAMMLTLEELIEFRGLYILEMRRKGGRSHTHHGRLRGTKTGHSTVGDGPFCDTAPSSARSVDVCNPDPDFAIQDRRKGCYIPVRFSDDHTPTAVK